jgi:hypothetical protein
MLFSFLVAGCGSKSVDTGEVIVDCSVVSTTSLPVPRGEHSGIWDKQRRRFVFFGGNQGIPVDCSYAQADFLDDLWAYYPDCDGFQDLEVAGGPGPRGRHAMSVDPERELMILHGGRYRALESSGDYTNYDDVWAFDLKTDSWTELSSGGGPEARVSHTAVVAGDRFVIHGGNSSENGMSYTPLEDVWAFDLVTNTWSELSASTGPDERLFHAGAVSDDGKTYYSFAGARSFTSFLNELWALDLESVEWTELHSGGDDAPASRMGPNLVVDDTRNRLLAFGGHDSTDLGNTNQVWAFDLDTENWSEVRLGDTYANPAEGACDFPPDFTDLDFDSPERRYLGAAFETHDDQMVVFGGKTDCGAINDVWLFDFETETWTEDFAATAGESCLRWSDDCSSLCQ